MIDDVIGLLTEEEQESTAPLWEGIEASKLVLQRCDECAYVRWPPSPICPVCQSPETTWDDIRPTATLITHCTYERALDPRFKDDIPYVIGYVQLSDGPRMYGRLSGDPASHHAGEPLHARFPADPHGPEFISWIASDEPGLSSQQEDGLPWNR